jgi:hypothetical protein
VTAGWFAKEAAMSGDHEMSGDYGYDLAHEVKSALQLPLPRAVVSPTAGGRTVGREIDPGSDFGYDQAHDF